MAIAQTIRPRERNLAGIVVRNVLPVRERSMVGPFIFMDQGGPLTLRKSPQHTGVPEHPHAGLSTFTYLLEGSQLHRDSAGHTAVFEAGDIALMSAGRGITHEELPDPADTSDTFTIYFAQMWLALPDAVEEMAPAFEHHASADLPVAEGKDARGRVLMGTAWGATAPTTCYLPTFFADIELGPGGEMPIPTDYDELALMLLEGDAELGAASLTASELNVLDGQEAVLSSQAGGRALLFGGARFPTPRYIGGSFVASSPGKLKHWMRASMTDAWPRIQR